MFLVPRAHVSCCVTVLDQVEDIDLDENLAMPWIIQQMELEEENIDKVLADASVAADFLSAAAAGGRHGEDGAQSNELFSGLSLAAFDESAGLGALTPRSAGSGSASSTTSSSSDLSDFDMDIVGTPASSETLGGYFADVMFVTDLPTASLFGAFDAVNGADRDPDNPHGVAGNDKATAAAVSAAALVAAVGWHVGGFASVGGAGVGGLEAKSLPMLSQSPSWICLDGHRQLHPSARRAARDKVAAGRCRDDKVTAQATITTVGDRMATPISSAQLVHRILCTTTADGIGDPCRLDGTGGNAAAYLQSPRAGAYDTNDSHPQQQNWDGRGFGAHCFMEAFDAMVGTRSQQQLHILSLAVEELFVHVRARAVLAGLMNMAVRQGTPGDDADVPTQRSQRAEALRVFISSISATAPKRDAEPGAVASSPVTSKLSAGTATPLSNHQLFVHAMQQMVVEVAVSQEIQGGALSLSSCGDNGHAYHTTGTPRMILRSLLTSTLASQAKFGRFTPLVGTDQVRAYWQRHNHDHLPFGILSGVARCGFIVFFVVDLCELNAAGAPARASGLEAAAGGSPRRVGANGQHDPSEETRSLEVAFGVSLPVG